MKLSLVFSMLSVLLLLSSCSQPEKTYSMPDTDAVNTIEIIDTEPIMYTEVVQKEVHAVLPQQQWEDWRYRYEAQDKYDNYIESWNRDAEWEAKEAELEDYCESLFSNSCLENMKEFCDHNGCRAVTVECDRFRDSDDVCVKYDITISNDIIES